METSPTFTAVSRPQDTQDYKLLEDIYSGFFGTMFFVYLVPQLSVQKVGSLNIYLWSEGNMTEVGKTGG